MKLAVTFKELKASGYVPKTVSQEIQANMIARIRDNKTVFEGLVGYEDSVVPQLKRAILAGHHINLLGLRGQAKTRIARSMVDLLDEYMPVVEGSEINDSPFAPISKFAVDTVAARGDQTPIAWVHRSKRFYEKLATPDVNISDLIGDVDPIKAATLKLPYSDERVLHYGMIPRANRCIFVINELPDLQARIQVALFNMLEEGDVQIRGFKLRLPLDVHFVFTANPEDYTNRGSIVTPLKDRIGSQILTHYAPNIHIAKQITQQETEQLDQRLCKVHVPELAKDILEQIAFEARDSEYIDLKSGVSARMSITAYENLVSTAERRGLLNHEKETTVRYSDLLGVIPSMIGKMELVYEGEQEGSAVVAEHLIQKATKTIFLTSFPKIEKLKKEDQETAYDEVLQWFIDADSFELLDEGSEKAHAKALMAIKPLQKLVQTYCPKVPKEDLAFHMEFVLWALTEFKQLSKKRTAAGLSFNDMYDSFLTGL